MGKFNFLKHPQGKAVFAAKIAELIPEHDFYIEPFCGGAAVFFAKRPAKREILADKNKWIVRFYKEVQRLTEKDLKRLRQLQWEWQDSESLINFFKRHNRAPTDRVEFIRWFRVLNAYSYSASGIFYIHDDGTLDDGVWGKFAHTFYPRLSSDWVDALETRFLPRLKGVEILCADALDLMDRYKGNPEAFWYFDPPYPQHKGDRSIFDRVWQDFDFSAFYEKLRQLRGKFIFSIQKRGFSVKSVPKGWSIAQIRVSSSFQSGNEKKKERVELLLANFKLQVRKEDKLTREEQQRQLERIIGDYYMIEENGEVHPAVLEYHLRGIIHSGDLDDVREAIRNAITDNDISALRKLFKQHGLFYLKTSLDDLKRDAQKADDERKDVTAAVRTHLDSWRDLRVQKQERILKIAESDEVWQAVLKHFEHDVEKLDEIKLDRIYALGNVHIDFRPMHPSERFLAGWTLDIPKIVLQRVSDGALVYPLRDRFFDWKPGDQFLAQKKLPEGLYYLTHSCPQIEHRPGEGGATPKTAGRFIFQAFADVVYGTQKSDFHELWIMPLSDEGLKKILQYTPKNKRELVKRCARSSRKFATGRWDFKLVKLLGTKPALIEEEREVKTSALERKGKFMWMVSKPWKTDKPYILTHDKRKEEEKAKRDKIELIWNETLIDILQERYGLRFKAEKRDLQIYVPIVKIDAPLRVVSAPVLVPDKIDKQRDIVRKRWIIKAAIEFAEKYGTAKIMHSKYVNAKLVENYVQPAPMEVDGKFFPEGTWWVGFKIYDNDVWELIRKGKLRGFSIGGRATRKKARIKGG